MPLGLSLSKALVTVLRQAQYERALELSVTTVQPEPVEGLGDSASTSSARAGSRAQHGRTLKPRTDATLE